MKKIFFCTKEGMTNTFINSKLEPVTVLRRLEIFPLEEKRTGNTLLFIPYNYRKLPKNAQGILKKYNLDYTHGILKEVYKPDLSKELPELVHVTGNTKGKGFCGAMKRWGFKGQGASHGVSLAHRSIGNTGTRDGTTVKPGKKMPGRMGNEQKTQKNLKVVYSDDQIICVKGSVCGPKNNFVTLWRNNE